MKKFLLLIGLLLHLYCSGREIQTYSGEFPDKFQGVYMTNLNATYDYYENNDFTRTYDGPFCLNFNGEPLKGQKRPGSIKGQFKNGYYDGEWVFVYPFLTSKFKDRMIYTPYTATLKCNFKNGKMDGEMEVIVTNSSKQVVAKTTIEFKDDKRNGPITHFCNIKDSGISNLEGQYSNDVRSGNWTYQYHNYKGNIAYDNGYEMANYVIDPATGEKREGVYIPMYQVYYGSVSVAELLEVINQLTNDESKGFRGFWNE